MNAPATPPGSIDLTAISAGRAGPERLDGTDPAKRRQIVTGARTVFLERGFEGASMGEIARIARVSKGTLYVYFQNKEELFCAIMEEERRTHVQFLQQLDRTTPVREMLHKFGTHIAQFLLSPAKIAGMRAAMGIAERMPEVGRTFYRRGPGSTIQTVREYLDAKVADGELDIADTELAAVQIIDLCQASLLRPALFGIEPAADERDAQIERVVSSAVTVFMRAYGPNPR